MACSLENQGSTNHATSSKTLEFTIGLNCSISTNVFFSVFSINAHTTSQVHFLLTASQIFSFQLCKVCEI
jgi:hypothetical protein